MVRLMNDMGALAGFIVILVALLVCEGPTGLAYYRKMWGTRYERKFVRATKREVDALARRAPRALP